MPLRRALPRLLIRLRRIVRNDQTVLSLLALLVGAAAALAALAFRTTAYLVQDLVYGSSSESFLVTEAGHSWWWTLLAPALGGLVIGLLIRWTLPEGRPQGVPQVMEAAALSGGRMALSTGLWAAAASAASIGVGASVGREGPVVHLGASLASWFARRLRVSPALTRTLLGCGVASAVAASFNAPIAGVFFALEVVIGHYALSAFAPIVLASVTGTVISRLHYGDYPAFILPEHTLVSFLEFPAFALLGLVSAVAAMLFMRSVLFAEDLSRRLGERLRVPSWLHPAVGGLLVGAIAIRYPHVLGVGYGTTDAALRGTLPFELLATLIVAKTAATAISLGSGFSGGLFSPSLYVGAMVGGAFGVVATGAFPELSSGYGAYAIVGMGAVAGPVLGAPISTIMIIFEMTGDYALTLAVMVGVVTASVVVTEVVGRSLFVWQLERRGVSLQGGREIGLLSAIRVADVMRRQYAAVAPGAGPAEITERLRTAPYGELFVLGPEERLLGVITPTDLGAATLGGDAVRTPVTAIEVARRDPPMLRAADDLREAMRLMDAAGESHVPVVGTFETRRVVGFVHERDVMLAYHRALVEARAEERGEQPRRRRRMP